MLSAQNNTIVEDADVGGTASTDTLRDFKGDERRKRAIDEVC